MQKAGRPEELKKGPAEPVCSSTWCCRKEQDRAYGVLLLNTVFRVLQSTAAYLRVLYVNRMLCPTCLNSKIEYLFSVSVFSGGLSTTQINYNSLRKGASRAVLAAGQGSRPQNLLSLSQSRLSQSY